MTDSDQNKDNAWVTLTAFSSIVGFAIGHAISYALGARRRAAAASVERLALEQRLEALEIEAAGHANAIADLDSRLSVSVPTPPATLILPTS